MNTAEDVLAFWLEELVPKDWYAGGDALDRQIKARFEAVWERAAEGGGGHWLTDARGTLAYILVTDQFSRNMFRGQGKAFDTDPSARAAARMALAKGWDMQIAEPQRQFFYLPLMHSEDLGDQKDCAALMAERMPQTGADNLRHAHAHLWVIETFGRFPYRNAALGRESTPQEADWMARGGYKLALEVVDER